MPKLQNDLAASGVDLLDHFFPCGNLSSGMNARSGRIALASWRDLRSLRDDQTAGWGALAVAIQVMPGCGHSER